MKNLSLNILAFVFAVLTPVVSSAQTNAEKAVFTGKKLTDKIYFRHSGYTGGTTFTPAGQMMEKFPTRVVEKAIRGMLPHNRLGEQMYRKLKVYAGSEHPHAAQQPEERKLNIR